MPFERHVVNLMGRHTDWNRDWEQMSCVILCGSFHITHEPCLLLPSANEGNVFGHVCLSVCSQGEKRRGPMWPLSMIQGPYRNHPRHVQTCSTLTSLYRDPHPTPDIFKLHCTGTPPSPNMFIPLALILTPTTQDMFKLVQCDARTVGKQEVHYYSGPNTSAVVQWIWEIFMWFKLGPSNLRFERWGQYLLCCIRLCRWSHLRRWRRPWLH